MYRIFRVEADDGNGPWNNGHVDIVDDLDINDHRSITGFPSLRNDGLSCNNSDYHCACPSACTFFLWFGPHIQTILKHYKVFTILTPERHISRSGIQIIYPKSKEIKRQQIYEKSNISSIGQC